MKTITVLKVDEWNGLYIDDDLIDEQHKFSLRDIGNILAKCDNHAKLRERWVDATPVDDYVVENSRFPKTLTECEELLGREI